MHKRANLFSYILNLFTNVLHLKFYQTNSCTSFNDQSSPFPSTLVELHIKVYLFDDFLYLLDGRFSQLRTFFVHVHNIYFIRSSISNKVTYASTMNSVSYCYNIYFEIRIAQAFPFLKDLTVSNLKPQNQKLNEDGRISQVSNMLILMYYV